MRTPPFSQLLEIRRLLELGWSKETAHQSYNGNNNSPSGQCYVSTLLGYILLESYKPKIVKGDIGLGDYNHYWLEIGDKIIDFTPDQYPELTSEKVIFSTYKEYPEYQKLMYEDGFPRFLMLARRLGIEITLNKINEYACAD